MKYFTLIFLLFISLSADDYAPINRNASKVVNIWGENGPPDNWTQPKKEQSVRSGGVTRVAFVNTPTLAFYPVKEKNKLSVIVCPGGGYRKLAYDKEGEEIAEWLNTLGYNAFVLKYRLPVKGDTRHIPPMQDAQRAVSLLRSEAAELHLDPKKIGIMGFSAGGHLSAVTTAAKERSYKQVDDIDKFSCEPNFGILIYPAYIKQTQEIFKVDKSTPPCFMAHAEDDKRYYINSPFFHKMLKDDGADSTFKSYKTGGHGSGMRKSGKEFDKWPEDLKEWLKRITQD